MSSGNSEEIIDIDYDMIYAFHEKDLKFSKEYKVFEMIYNPNENTKEKKVL